MFASQSHVDIAKLLSTVFGTGLVIACACVLNNYIDRDIDRKMDRTKSRELVTGEITVIQAIGFAIIMGVIGFYILFKQANLLTVIIGLVGLVDYVIIYGYFKRRSVHGTLIGSIAGSTPIAAGYCAVTNHIDSVVIILFLIMEIWQMPHFYAIAIYRLKDYKAAGLPIWSVKKGIESTKTQILSYIVIFIGISIMPSTFGYTSYTYLVVMLGFGIWWLRNAISGLRILNTDKWARGIFGNSLIILLVFSLLLSIDRYLL